MPPVRPWINVVRAFATKSLDCVHRHRPADFHRHQAFRAEASLIDNRGVEPRIDILGHGSGALGSDIATPGVGKSKPKAAAGRCRTAACGRARSHGNSRRISS